MENLRGEQLQVSIHRQQKWHTFTRDDVKHFLNHNIDILYINIMNNKSALHIEN